MRTKRRHWLVVFAMFLVAVPVGVQAGGWRWHAVMYRPSVRMYGGRTALRRGRLLRVDDDDWDGGWHDDWGDDGWHDDGWPGWGFYWAQPPVRVYVPARHPPHVVYIEPGTRRNRPYYWYHCSSPKGYYPYVKQCPPGWVKVVPHPPHPLKPVH